MRGREAVRGDYPESLRFYVEKVATFSTAGSWTVRSVTSPDRTLPRSGQPG